MNQQKVSGWEKASTIATFLQTGAVVVSLVFIVYQLHQQTKLSRAANVQALVNLVTPLNLKVTDREMTELWLKGEEGIDKVVDAKERDVERERYETLVASYMIFYENVYSQYHKGLLDDDIYKGWDKDLESFIEDHQLEKHWDEWKGSYHKDFSGHVDEIIKAQKSKPTP